jgi:hypothetical protein
VGAVLATVVKVDGVSSVEVRAFWGAISIAVPELFRLAIHLVIMLSILTVRV